MATESKSVDVFKALRVGAAYCYESGAPNAAKNLNDASDAVGELIEAARDYADVEANAYDITQRIPAATRLRAALARVRGEA